MDHLSQESNKWEIQLCIFAYLLYSTVQYSAVQCPEGCQCTGTDEMQLRDEIVHLVDLLMYVYYLVRGQRKCDT